MLARLGVLASPLPPMSQWLMGMKRRSTMLFVSDAIVTGIISLQLTASEKAMMMAMRLMSVLYVRLRAPEFPEKPGPRHRHLHLLIVIM